MAMKPAGVRRYHQSEASSNFRGGESDFEGGTLGIVSSRVSQHSFSHSLSSRTTVKRESAIEENLVPYAAVHQQVAFS